MRITCARCGKRKKKLIDVGLPFGAEFELDGSSCEGDIVPLCEDCEDELEEILQNWINESLGEGGK